MKSGKICYCKVCGTLDYADGKCPKCGNTEIDEASMDFLLFGSDLYPFYIGRSINMEQNRYDKIFRKH